MKTCFKCNTTHPLEDFHKHKGMKDGHLNKCKHCVVKEVDAWRLRNPEARKKEHARVRERTGHMTRQEYFDKRSTNKVGRKVISLKYAYKRRRLEEKTFQSELDEFVFEEAALLCKLREQITGFKWHIDHIVPMMHKDACGLNTACNLQVVPALWNIRKGNRNMNEFFPYSGLLKENNV
jgi:hypothetical protein